MGIIALAYALVILGVLAFTAWLYYFTHSLWALLALLLLGMINIEARI